MDVQQLPGILQVILPPDPAECDARARRRKPRYWPVSPSQESTPEPSDSGALLLLILYLWRPGLHQWAKNAHVTHHHLSWARRA